MKLHKGWEGVNLTETYEPARNTYCPFITALLVLTITLFIFLWAIGDCFAAEDCLDGTWVHSQEINNFVCVPDGPDGYQPPSD